MFGPAGMRGRPRTATGVSTSRRTDAPPRARARADVRESRPGIRAALAQQGSDRREGDPRLCRCLLPQRVLERFDEHRVARVLRDPLSAEERQVREIEVADAPAEHRRVEREDDRAAPAALSPRDEARDELVRRAPVELEPARCVAHGTRCFLHRARGLVGEDERDALRGGCARNGDVRVAVRHLQDADRTEDERARKRRAEQLGRPAPAPRRRAASAARCASARTRRGSRASSPRFLRRPRRRRIPPATWPCAPPARAARRRRERPGTCPARRRRRSRTVARARSR